MPRVLLLAPFLLLSACAEPGTETPDAEPFDLTTVRTQIESSNLVFGEGLRAGDAERIAALYTEDARFLSPDSTVRVGREAIRDYWQESLAFLADMTLTTQSLNGTRDVLYETGEVDTSIGIPDGVFVQRDKYVNVWVRQPDGQYRIAIDMWNSRPE